MKCQLISRVAGQFEGGRGLPSFAKFQQFFYFKFFFSVQSLFPVGFWCAEFRVPYLRPGNVGVGRHFVFCFFFRSLFSFCFLLFLFVAFLFLSRRRRRRNQKRIGNRRCLPVCFCFSFGSVFFFFSRAAIFNKFFFSIFLFSEVVLISFNSERSASYFVVTSYSFIELSTIVTMSIPGWRTGFYLVFFFHRVSRSNLVTEFFFKVT